MTQVLPRLQEEFSAKIPALSLLCNLGWKYLTPETANTLRNGKTSVVVLIEELRSVLKKRRFMFEGGSYSLSDQAIDSILQEVGQPALNEGLSGANEKIYNHLMYGIPVTEFIDGRKASPTIPLIDWNTPENNSLVFTEEYRVLANNGVDYRIPDIVCFVNGFPLVVIEAKRPDRHSQSSPTIDEGISQSLRNQRNDEIPQLFAYSQLILAINGIEGCYATQGTSKPFWAIWREEEITEAECQQLKNSPLDHQQYNEIFNHRKPESKQWYEALLAQGDLAVTDQDRLIISLLTPARLLDITRFAVLYDKKIGKIVARYQQYFGIRELIKTINTRDKSGAREGGVIWHTTGSGKSFTMVFLTKALVLHQSLKNCRLLVVTDRHDLESQLSNTFTSGGALNAKRDKSEAMATSGSKLAKMIGSGHQRIIFSLIQKFTTATKLPECHNNSDDLIVLIDEGHRSQGGENHTRMRQTLPNAAFIAFTGTPLLKDDKTENKFGRILHSYTMQRAVEDKAVTPLLYEERIPDLEVNQRAIDNWFERITKGLSAEQTSDLKRRYAQKGQVYQSDDRIRLIAWDIAAHFVYHIESGLKGMVACDSRASAILYKKYLDETGLLKSAVVMSAPDTREGHTSVDDTGAPDLVHWWKENIGNEDEAEYTSKVVERFEKDEALKLIIVVSKLLTGFDEPKNAVLYIDKPLKDHNLIQAIARVNRLHEKKQFGLLIDYRGILSELDTTIRKYQDLAKRTQGGYDVADIAGLYQSVSTEYKRLPQLHDQLWDLFTDATNKSDYEQLRQVLIPKMIEDNGEWRDKNQKLRDDFYDNVTAFTNCLSVALQSVDYFKDSFFSEADRQHYKDTAKTFIALRKIVRQDAGETVDYGDYSEEVKKLVDKHVVGVSVAEPTGVYDVGKMGQTYSESWSDDKTRNETDIIKTRITRTIEHNLRSDPYAQEAFSKLLKQAISDAAALFGHPMKQYMLFVKFEADIKDRKLDGIPDFNGNHSAQAYYGLFKQNLPSAFDENSTPEKWIALANNVDQVVLVAVAEFSINPQNIEIEIRQRLLPSLFKVSKQHGYGMGVAKAILESIIKITRVGLNGTS